MQVPKFETPFKGRAGVSDGTFEQSLESARAVKVDVLPIATLRDDPVAEAAKYFDTLTNADLSRVVDLTGQNYGTVTLSIGLSDFIIGHIHDMMREMSVTKGLLGKKGDPF